MVINWSSIYLCAVYNTFLLWLNMRHWMSVCVCAYNVLCGTFPKLYNSGTDGQWSHRLWQMSSGVMSLFIHRTGQRFGHTSQWESVSQFQTGTVRTIIGTATAYGCVSICVYPSVQVTHDTMTAVGPLHSCSKLRHTHNSSFWSVIVSHQTRRVVWWITACGQAW